MSKKIVLTLALLLTVTSTVMADDSENLLIAAANGSNKAKSSSMSGLDKDTIYYPNATVKSALAKYKGGNYTGCLQELFSVTKKDPSNALAYYYMAMAYTHLDMQADAVEAYEKVISLNPNNYLTDYATKGRDCLTGGPACMTAEAAAAANTTAEEASDDLDKFVNSPYGNGLSPEMNAEQRQKQLTNIKDTINKKENLEVEDLDKIKEFDLKNNNQSYDEDETIKIAQVSDEEILQAVRTLKDAGLTLNVQSADNPYAMMSQYQDPKMAEMSMLLGNNNYNNNSNSMMNMLPVLMTQAQKGENIDPRLMQSMMMNSMMSDWSFNNNNNNRY